MERKIFQYKMKSFNPYKYSDLSKSSVESVDLSDKIVEKGHKNIVKVDLKKFEEKCIKIKERKDVKIKKLTGMDKEIFDELVKYVHLLYGTEYYNNLYDTVQKIFKNIGHVKYGTVGSYFSGCLNNKNGCSLACAGGMPMPKSRQSEENNICDKAVIMGELNSIGNYEFSFIRPAEKQEDLDNAYLFVENSENGFSGLAAPEKLYLKNLGCKQLKVISYSDDMTYNSTDSYVSIDDIKERQSKNSKNSSKSNHSNLSKSKYSSYNSSESGESQHDSFTWFMWFLVFIIILIILILAALYYYKKYKN